MASKNTIFMMSLLIVWTYNNKRVARIHISLVRIKLDKELIFYHRLGLTLVKYLLGSFEF